MSDTAVLAPTSVTAAESQQAAAADATAAAALLAARFTATGVSAEEILANVRFQQLTRVAAKKILVANAAARLGGDAVRALVEEREPDLATKIQRSLVEAAFEARAERLEEDDVDLPEEQERWADNAGNSLSTQLVAEASVELAKPVEEHLGVKLKKLWMSRGDNKVRGSHRKLHGSTAELDKPFWRELGTGRALRFPGDPAAPIEQTINCFPEGERVGWIGDLQAVTRRWYEGTLIELRTADGVRLTVTPNHPVLTLDGWVAAEALEVGDQVLHVHSGEGSPEVDDMPPAVEQVYRAACQVATKVRRRGASMDFHGDGSDGEVEVVATNGELLTKLHTEGGQVLSHFDFFSADGSAPAFLGDSGTPRALVGVVGVGVTESLLRGCRCCPSGGVGLLSKPTTFLRRHALHPQFVGLRGGSERQSVVAQSGGDRCSSDSVVVGEGEDADTLVVELDELISVRRFPASTHVYSLQSSTGYLISNGGVLVSNCRCWLWFVPEDQAAEAEKTFQMPESEFELIAASGHAHGSIWDLDGVIVAAAYDVEVGLTAASDSERQRRFEESKHERSAIGQFAAKPKASIPPRYEELAREKGYSSYADYVKRSVYGKPKEDGKRRIGGKGGGSDADEAKRATQEQLRVEQEAEREQLRVEQEAERMALAAEIQTERQSLGTEIQTESEALQGETEAEREAQRIVRQDMLDERRANAEKLLAQRRMEDAAKRGERLTEDEALQQIADEVAEIERQAREKQRDADQAVGDVERSRAYIRQMRLRGEKPEIIEAERARLLGLEGKHEKLTGEVADLHEQSRKLGTSDTARRLRDRVRLSRRAEDDAIRTEREQFDAAIRIASQRQDDELANRDVALRARQVAMKKTLSTSQAGKREALGTSQAGRRTQLSAQQRERRTQLTAQQRQRRSSLRGAGLTDDEYQDDVEFIVSGGGSAKTARNILPTDE